MDPNSQRPKGRDRIFSSLNLAIEALNIAKDASGIPPAQAVFGSVSALLTMIRVRFLLFYDDELRVDTYLGHDGQPDGLHRTWVILRRCLRSH